MIPGLYNISKKVRNGVHFLHSDKYWSFYKLILFFSGSGQAKVLQLLGRGQTKVLQLLLCSMVMENIQIFYGFPVMFAVTCFWVAVVKNVCSLLGHATLKSVIIEVMKWADFLQAITNYWVGHSRMGDLPIMGLQNPVCPTNHLMNQENWLNNFCILIVIE